MKKVFLLPCIFVFLATGFFMNSKAQTAGDTIHIQAFTFGSSQDSFFVFPPDTIRYEKILMYYRLKCPANGICGDWDKITNTYLKQHTQTYDTAGKEIINYFELGRYITPYGKNLNLGNGFTWTYDLSDYAPLLHDTVYISAGNGQEALDMTFDMIKGIPPRDPIKVENIWNLSLDYASQDSLAEMKMKIDSTAKNFRYKMRTTGHGFGGAENCSEFCPRHHHLVVNGVNRWDTLVWRNNCSYNPLYPQGGTWLWNRANWCPGADVATYDFELTPYVTPGDSVSLLYYIDPYAWNNQGTRPSYTIATQLISYKAPNFTLDATITDIKAPSTADIYKRINPLCAQPIITIQNTGTTPLTGLTITYGIVGGDQSVFNWTGNLKFLEKQDVTLPAFNWSKASNKFRATVANPNGGTDEYVNNNGMESTCSYPPQYVGDLIFELFTNNYSNGENSYTIKDDAGNIVFQRSNLLNSTLYRDTLHLANGCYQFRLQDDWGVTNKEDPFYNQGDGMTSIYDAGTTLGHMFIRKVANNLIVKNFSMDFGHELFQQFTVGYFLDLPEPVYEDAVAVYPNPSKGIFNLDMSFSKGQTVAVTVYDMTGRLIMNKICNNVHAENNRIDLSGYPDGIYFMNVYVKDKIISRRLVKQD